MRSILSILFLTLAVVTSYAQMKPKTTTDRFVLGQLLSADYVERSAISVDGSSNVQRISIDGGNDDPVRVYCAYNLDITLPYGFEVLTDEGNPMVGMGDTSFYSKYKVGRNEFYNHFFSSAVLPGNILRVACSSNSNASFNDVDGVDVLEFWLKVNSPYVKPGRNALQFSGLNMTIKENAQKYVPADCEEYLMVDEGEVSVNIIVSAANQYSAVVLPFDAPVPAGLVAYECGNIDNDIIHLKKVDNFAAYTPYVVFAETGYTGTLTGQLSAAKYEARVKDGITTNGLLAGAITPQAISSGYVLQNLEQGVQFYSVDNQTFSIPAGKCWLSTSADTKSFSFVIDGDESDVNSFIIPTSTTNADIYGLNGISQSSIQEGINIINGQKVLKK